MILDCKGKACPQPVVLSIKALKELKDGEALDVIVDNRAAVENVSRMGESKKCEVCEKDNGDGTWTLTLSPQGAIEGGLTAEDEAAMFCTIPSSAPKAGPSVIAIGSNEMGQGDPKLGHNLMKAFIYAVAQQEKLPDVMLFFNGGAYLTVEDSESLADIKDMAERGVEIMTCGTCLDFYGIKDKLAVGSVTNMYSIVENMMKAGSLVRI